MNATVTRQTDSQQRRTQQATRGAMAACAYGHASKSTLPNYALSVTIPKTLTTAALLEMVPQFVTCTICHCHWCQLSDHLYTEYLNRIMNKQRGEWLSISAHDTISHPPSLPLVNSVAKSWCAARRRFAAFSSVNRTDLSRILAHAAFADRLKSPRVGCVTHNYEFTQPYGNVLGVLCVCTAG